jgi:hypothetical protein
VGDVVRLESAREGWIISEVLEALTHRWKDTSVVVKSVRRRYGWAADVEIYSALDRLWDEERIESRTTTRPDPSGSGSPIHGSQWRLIGES